MTLRYNTDDLREFANRLLKKTGLDNSLTLTLSEVLLEADLLGFYTHGFFRLPENIQWIEKGETRKSGEPNVLVDRGAIINWDAGYLPGPCVMNKGVKLLCDRAKTYGVATLIVRKSQHIACLAPYVLKAAEKGLLAWMVAATPAESQVCPHGGTKPVFSTNPFAFAAPTGDDPVLMDFSFAQTSGGKLKLANLEGKEMPFPCVLDEEGHPSQNPIDALKGGLLPLGGIDTGYKGYGLLLWSELLTTALGGWGRVNHPDDGDANSVTLQVMDPEAFAPQGEFMRQADYITEFCRQTPVREGEEQVRIPGSRALKRRLQQIADGVQLPPVIMEQLKPVAEKYREELPLSL